MTKRIFWGALTLGCLMVAPAIAQSSPTCGPLDDGRVANVFYQGTTVFFEPIVEYEYDLAVLTISGPCEDIVRNFKRGEEIFFDIREIERVTDGHYTWQLRFEPTIDSGVREELQASRGTGEEDAVWWHFWQKGAIPDGPRVDSESFTVFRGGIIDPNSGEEKRASVAGRSATASVAASAAGIAGGGASSASEGGIAGGGASSASESGDGPVLSTKDFVINDDLIVIGSTCIGFDCVNGEVFSFDTLRFRENNLRIKFDDTSVGSFPTRNWEIEINSSANGGQTHFRVNDVDAGRAPFTIEGASPSHSLYVDSSGRVGMGTSTPVTELHVASGDTPTLRLDQNTSSGFASQVWDVAGNETSFFVRDATNGSTLPFRIFPGSSSSRLVIRNNKVGIGTSSPTSNLHVVETGGNAELLFDASASANVALDRGNQSSFARLQLLNAGTSRWSIGMINDSSDNLHMGPNTSTTHLFINQSSGNVGIGTTTPQGKLDVNGAIYQRGGVLHADYVFDPSYSLESIEEHADFMWRNKHLPAMPKAVADAGGREVVEIGAHRRGMLEELEKAHIYIDELNGRLKEKESQLAELEDDLLGRQKRLEDEITELKELVRTLRASD